jgi:hypothetical protein
VRWCFAALAGLLLFTSNGPAFAQMWRHQQSGIAIRELPEGLRLGQVRQLATDGSDVVVTLGREGDAVTLFIYRAAYPNPALWFERARSALNRSLLVTAGRVDARPFTLGPAAAPNGLREEIDLPAGARAKSTAVAIAQHGEWLVKLRITSLSDNGQRLRERMDELIAALAVPPQAQAPLPLRVPSACSNTPALAGRPIESPDPARLRPARETAQAVAREARARGGPAAAPGQWCRATTTLPPDLVSVFRRLDGKGWVVLFGDSGQAVSGQQHAGAPGAAVYGSMPSGTVLAAIYDSLPAPEAAVEAALPFASGRQRGIDGQMYGRVTPP